MEDDGQNQNPPAGDGSSQNDETQVQGTDGRTVPYSRFQEVNRQRRDLERQMADIVKARDEALSQVSTLTEAQKAQERAALVQQVARELNVPDALVGRLQGDTVEAIKADAEALLAAIPGKPAPNIDARTGNGDGDNQAPTFTMAQVNDPDFYQKNRAAILAAMAAGRITK